MENIQENNLISNMSTLRNISLTHSLIYFYFYFLLFVIITSVSRKHISNQDAAEHDIYIKKCVNN